MGGWRRFLNKAYAKPPKNIAQKYTNIILANI
jgi:hypothetical protein